MKGFLSPSEFAHISGVCRKTLIFYDNTDLFKPAHVDAKGYRYYSHDQIYEISTIGLLLELGMSHREVKDFMRHTNPAEALALLDRQSKAIKQEMRRLQGVMDMLGARKAALLEGMSSDGLMRIVRLEKIPVRLSDEVGGLSLVEIEDDVWISFYDQCAKEGNSFGYPEGHTISKESLEMGEWKSVERLASFVGAARYANASIPEGDYLVAISNGVLEDCSASFEEAFRYIEENGLAITGEGFAKRLIDESGAKERSEQRTMLAIPVSSQERSEA